MKDVLVIKTDLKQIICEDRRCLFYISKQS